MSVDYIEVLNREKMKKKILFALSSLTLLGLFIIFGTVGVYKTENGIVLGLPDHEKRSIHVEQVDLEILKRADALLSSKDVWRKERVADCALSEKLDLYCSLEKASIDVMGDYVHRRPALQEVRFTIDDAHRDRWESHRLIDFNENKDTTFSDVKAVLAQTIATVEKKLDDQKKQIRKDMTGQRSHDLPSNDPLAFAYTS